MQTLLAFEAAARHLNFTKAAQELNLTQTAISHQIRNLERRLGVKLFTRQRNTLILTSAARDYLHTVSTAIELVASATETTKRSKPDSTLSIVCLPTYATQCLIPALPEFQRLYPHITVHLLTNSAFSEFERANYDIAIRYGTGKWNGFRSDLLHEEEFFPICAPSLLPQDSAWTERQLLAQLPQIRTYFYSLYQDDWPTWLTAAGYAGAKFKGMSVFHMQLASLEAAVAGSGLAIGRTPLVNRYLASGAIVAPFRKRVQSESAYYLSAPAGKAEQKNVELFRRWALQRLGSAPAPAAATRQPGPAAPEGAKKNPHGYKPTAVLLEEWRARSPDKYALIDVCRDQRLTFDELAALVEHVASQLNARGLAPGDRVILFMNDGLEKIVLWLALWRLAAVVCPIDLSRFRTAAADKVCATIAPRWIACNAGAAPPRISPLMLDRILRVGTLDAPPGPPADCDIGFTQPGAGMAAPPSRPADGDDIAAICSTSGTTGEPKLVVHDHLAYWIHGKNIVERLALTEHDRLLEYRSFDWSSAQILSLMAFLQLGLTLHVAPRFSRSAFARWVAQHKISVSVGVPAVINLLLQKPEELSASELSSLRYITCSTSSLPTAQWLRFEQIFRVRLLNIYGSTEAGWMCSNRSDDIQVGTVGAPMPGVSIEIVDDNGHTCPVDVIGQVMVRGPALALGLLKPDGELDRIRDHRLATNDLGAMDRSGAIRITGRVDDLIIRGGVKIYPRDIEDVLLAHPDVLDAAVVGAPDDIYGQSPVCFFVPRSNFSDQELQAYCERNLPHEAMPKHIVKLKKLPRNARGKLLRGDLLKHWLSGLGKPAEHDTR